MLIKEIILHKKVYIQNMNNFTSIFIVLVLIFSIFSCSPAVINEEKSDISIDKSKSIDSLKQVSTKKRKIKFNKRLIDKKKLDPLSKYKYLESVKNDKPVRYLF